MLNHIDIMGRLTADPDLRYTQSQTPVVSFRIACDRDFGDRDGVRPVDFISCVAWRGTAEFISKYFFRGSMIIASGRLQMREYTDRSGYKRTEAEVVCDTAYFGGSKQSGEKRTTEAPADAVGGSFGELDDDFGEVPF